MGCAGSTPAEPIGEEQVSLGMANAPPQEQASGRPPLNPFPTLISYGRLGSGMPPASAPEPHGYRFKVGTESEGRREVVPRGWCHELVYALFTPTNSTVHTTHQAIT